MIFNTLSDLGYGQLHLAVDAATGLRALIALHSTRLGPAIGGCRVRVYEDEQHAVHDVTRLARAMGYKAAVAGLNHGGGKAVIWAKPAIYEAGFNRKAYFEAFGRFVDQLHGSY